MPGRTVRWTRRSMIALAMATFVVPSLPAGRTTPLGGGLFLGSAAAAGTTLWTVGDNPALRRSM